MSLLYGNALACRDANINAAFVLLDHGADSSVKSGIGQTDQDVAQNAGFWKLIQDMRGKVKMEKAALQEETKSEKALSSEQVIKLVPENEQHKLEMTSLQDKMKAETVALAVQEHKLVLENEQFMVSSV
jgi:tellurite resistance-related uncharacterized protein